MKRRMGGKNRPTDLIQVNAVSAYALSFAVSVCFDKG